MHKVLRVLLIGPVAPPVGGVASHISRFLESSEKFPEVRVSCLDLRKWKVFNRGKKSRWVIPDLIRADILHIHVSKKIKIFLALMAKFTGKKVVYTHHNSRDLDSPATRKMIRICDRIIFVLDPGKVFPVNLANTISILPASIPSNLPAMDVDIPELWKKAEYRMMVLATPAVTPDTDAGEEDVYGLDILLDALEQTGNRLAGSSLLFCDPNATLGSLYLNRLKKLTAELGIACFLVKKNSGFIAALKQSNVFIRPTRSDGDALSVREALACGVPVIASDCVARPEGVVLFKTGNSGQLAKTIIEVKQDPHPVSVPQPDCTGDLIRYYTSLWKKKL
ncbi:MAG: glycosyltransferase family 4 protein [Bacteroidia bacterium]|nr:glycosyltransferase family 4 protein [Bacteroidia bacterium]